MPCWTDRPPPPLGAVVLHDLRYAGEEAAAKLARVRAEHAENSAPMRWWFPIRTRCRWLFNIRGSDVPHTPVVLAFAMVPKEGRPALYVDGRKLGNDVRHRLEELAEVRAPADFERDLAALGKAQRAVRLDPAACPEAIARLIADNGGKVLRGSDPIAPMKAVKNAAEIAGARAAQQRDGAAVTRFLAWFDREAPRGTLDRDRRGRGAGEFPPRHRRCSRTFRFPPSPAPAPTAPSCITASPARATGASRRASCF